MVDSAGPSASRIVGRYSLFAEIAHGGMATVHVGRLMGPVGFSRTVAIKRLHGQFAKDPEFVAMFMDEARLAARIQHPNVVSIIDVVAEQGELLLVMDYIQGESLSRLLRAEREQGRRVDPRIAVKIMTEVLAGLHAAHEVKNERGAPLGVVHRDMSPQNILVGVDGVARLIDFGVAKAAGRIQSTREGQLKGKLPYMAPEQIRSGEVDRRTDVYASAAVLWEILVGQRLFKGDEANLMFAVLTAPIAPPRTVVPELDAKLDAAVVKGLQRNPSKRFSTALEMADALEAAVTPATSREVARWLDQLASTALQKRADLVAEVESFSHVSVPPKSAIEAADMISDLSARSNAAVVADAASAGVAEVSSAPQIALSAEAGVLASSTEQASPLISEVPTQTSSTISGARVLGSLRPSRWPWLAVAAAIVLVVASIAFMRWRSTSSSSAATGPTESTTTAVQVPLDAGLTVAELPRPSASPSPSASVSAEVLPIATAHASTTAKPGKASADVAAPAASKKKPSYTRD